MTEYRKVYGLGAEFSSAADLLHAAEKIRDAGFSKWDVHTPFPVHGMDKAMGLGKSWLSLPVLIGGVTGLITAVALECIPSFHIYPVIVHGKPYDWRTLPAFFPIMFELTVLFSAFTTITALLVMNQLPRWYHPVFNWERFTKVTDDGFFLIIEARDPKFSETKTRELLESEASTSRLFTIDRTPMLRYFFLCFIVVVAGTIALAGFRGEKSPNPPLQIFPDMKAQPRFDPQHPSSFFNDGRADRNLVEGTIPFGYNVPNRFYQTTANNRLENAHFSNQPDYLNTGRMGDVYGDGLPDGIEASDTLLARGRERFNISCAICHGKTAAGDGIVKAYGLATVASLQDERIRTMPDGQIFSTITNGKNTMGAYGPLIAVEDRWAIISYLRALQRSQNAKLAELPEAEQKELNSKQ